MRWAVLIVPAALVSLGLPPAMATDLDGIRGSPPVTAASPPLPLARRDIKPDRQPRIAHDQPPVIPHSIRRYQIKAGSNRCLACHGPDRTAQSSAPLISRVHLVDRDRRVHASIEPGHYFCLGCHVPQSAVTPPIGNTFQIRATVPYRRFMCMECHLPQTGISPKPSPASPSGNDNVR